MKNIKKYLKNNTQQKKIAAFAEADNEKKLKPNKKNADFLRRQTKTKWKTKTKT